MVTASTPVRREQRRWRRRRCPRGGRRRRPAPGRRGGGPAAGGRCLGSRAGPRPDRTRRAAGQMLRQDVFTRPNFDGHSTGTLASLRSAAMRSVAPSARARRRSPRSPSSPPPAATTTAATTPTPTEPRTGRRRRAPPSAAARPSPSATRPGPAGSRWPSPRRQGIFEEVGLDVDLRVLRRLPRLARRHGRRPARRQHPDPERHDVRRRRRRRAGDRRRQRQLDRQRRHHLRRVDHSRSRTSRARRSRPRPGVVDHFLLLQGLDSVGHDRGRHRLPRRAHRRRGGRLRRRRVRLRRRVRPVHAHRPRAARARTCCSTARRLPRHHLRPHRGVARADRGAARATSRSWSTPGTSPSTTSRPTPRRRTAIMAEVAETSRRGVRAASPRAPTLFTAEEAARPPSRTATTRPRCIYTAELINPFLVESGLTEEEAPARRPLRRQLHGRLRRAEPVEHHGRPAPPWPTVAGAPAPPAADAPAAAGSAACAAGASRRLLPAAGRHPAVAAARARRASAWSSLLVGWALLAVDDGRRLVPGPDAGGDAGTPRVELWQDGDLWTDLRGQHSAGRHRLRDQHGHRDRASACSSAASGRVEAFLEPQIGFLRYIPASALTPAVPAVAGHRRGPEDRADRASARSSTTS